MSADPTSAAARALTDIDPTPAAHLTPVVAGDRDQPGDSWEPVDIAQVLHGITTGRITRPTPTILARTDGQALLYPGKVNGIAGASGDGKSMIAQWATVEQLHAGHAVVCVDLEDDAASVVARLLAMGATPEQITDLFVYVSPDEPYGPGAQARLEELVTSRAPTLVVVDSTGESLALDGARPNDDDDVARWFRRLPTALARLGPAVLVVDHLAKADDGSLSPIGSQRKRAAISGQQLITKLVRPFSRTTPGVVKVICGKDRAGTYRRGETVAEIAVESTDTTISVTVAAPAADGQAGSFRPTVLMQRVSKLLEESPDPLSRNRVCDAVTGQKAAIGTALSVLVDEGFVVREQDGQTHLHRSVRPFREGG